MDKTADLIKSIYILHKNPYECIVNYVCYKRNIKIPQCHSSLYLRSVIVKLNKPQTNYETPRNFSQNKPII